MAEIDEQREDAYIAQIERVRLKLQNKISGVESSEQKAIDIAVDITKEVAADRRQDIISSRMKGLKV